MGAAAAARTVGTQGREEQRPEPYSEGGTHHQAAAGRARSQGVGGPRPSVTPCQEAEGLPARDGTGEAPAGSQGVLTPALQSEVAAGQPWCSFEAGRLLPSCVHQGPRAKGGRLLSFPG